MKTNNTPATVNANNTNVANIVATLSERNEIRNKIELPIIAAIRTQAAKFNGKVFNRRFTAAVTKALEGNEYRISVGFREKWDGTTEYDIIRVCYCYNGKYSEFALYPDDATVKSALENVQELAKELRTDYPTDTPDDPTNWNNKARNRRNTLIRAQFTDCGAWSRISGDMWLELFDLIGFTVDKETRKRFASHLNWYGGAFGYASFKPRLSSKYAQRIHWYVQNFLICLNSHLQTEKDYRAGKYGAKSQAYYLAIENQATQTPTDGANDMQTVNVSPEQENADRERENEPHREFEAA